MDRFPEIVEAPEENEVEQNLSMDIEDQEPQEEVEEPVEVIPKPVIPQKEIFKNKNTNNPLEVEKVKKPKRQISDKQRENLRIAREKALEKRRANAKARKEGTMPTKKEQEIIDKKPVVNNIVHEHKTINNNFTREDIESMAMNAASKASAKALEEYETVRKYRKEEKKKKQAEQAERQKIKDTIQKATKVVDPFDFCY